jgi:hypothetical protein
MVVLENERRAITSSNCIERSVGKSSNVKHDHASIIPPQPQYSSYVSDVTGVLHIWTQTEFFKRKKLTTITQ